MTEGVRNLFLDDTSLDNYEIALSQAKGLRAVQT